MKNRVLRSHDQTRKTYDRISPWYDWLEGNWESNIRQIAVGRLALREGECVLEIGFGTGQGLVEIARAVGETGTVSGIDLSPRMVERAHGRISAAGLADTVGLETGDASHLPFAAGRFDAVLMSFVLELFDSTEIPQVLSECHRVLKAGGRIGVASLSKAGAPNWMRSLYEWGHARLPSLLDCRPIFAEEAIGLAGFQILDSLLASCWGLPVENVIGLKLQ